MRGDNLANDPFSSCSLPTHLPSEKPVSAKPTRYSTKSTITPTTRSGYSHPPRANQATKNTQKIARRILNGDMDNNNKANRSSANQ